MLADGNGLVKIPRTLFAQETDTIRITARDDTQEKEVSLDKDTSGVRVVYFEKKPPALSAEILHARLQKQPAPEVVVDAVVHNDSENEVRSVEVTLFDAATKTPYDMETIEHLPGTSDKNIRLRVPFSKVNTDNNKVSLLLVVDPHNYNNEVDTLDNIAAYTASLAADLAIEPGSIKTVPEYVRAGEAVKVQFDIYNNSDIPIQDSTVAAIGITGEAGNTILREFMVPPLAENETKHVVSPSFVLEKSGGHKLFIGLNNSDKLSESNKLNNTSFFSVTASEKLLPDFEVNADSIELVPADCVLGRPNKIYLRLKNSGPADGTATVTMYIDKTKMTEEAVAIHKKEELVLSPKLWFPSAKGPVEIGLFVDENNEKEEANKYNNAVIKTFEVRDFTYPATLGKILDTAIYPENVIAEDASSAAAYLDLSKTSYAQWNFSGGKIALSKSPEKLTVHLVPFLFDNNVSPSTVTGTFELVEEGDDAKSEIIAENVTITSDEPVTLSLADKKIEPTKNMSIKILFKNENGNKTFFASTKNLFITLD